MTMENSGHDGAKPVDAKVQPPVAGNVPNPSRRRFNRAGVGASAVVMTLASRSVLANMACTPASGFQSANMSHQGRPGDPPIACDGLNIQGWMTTADWHPPRTTSFKDAFGTMPRPDLIVGTPVIPPALATRAPTAKAADTKAPATMDNSNSVGASSDQLKLKEATLEQALNGSQTPLVVKHLIAALLNANSNRSTYPTAKSVQDIFADWNAHGTYEVTAGIRWSEAEIIEYLQYTQTQGPITFPPKRI